VRILNFDKDAFGEDTRYDLQVNGGGTVGRITGKVMDAVGEAVCDAVITTDGIGVGISVCPGGDYALIEMPGNWRIYAEKDGYENYDSDSSVEVLAGEDTNHDILMSPVSTTTSSENGECTVIIDPKTKKVKSGDSVSFTVYTNGNCSAPDYEWSVESDIGSIIDQNGNYVAGTNDAIFNKAIDVVMVDDNANDTKAAATVTVSRRCISKQIYGENSEEVATLRSLRDNVLNQTPEGREIIRLYYEWSPVIVQEMEENEEFKKGVKEIIDEILLVIGF